MQSTESAALDAEIFDGIAETKQALSDAIHKTVIGQDEVIELVLITLLAQGHALLIGVPGLAKTLLVRTVADALGLGFRRIQFTPDLMPTDILGTEVLEENRQSGERSFRFVPGPVFTHLLLADEINRTPPKTQAALLEAMQESAVTVAGETRALDAPFCVLATQNPIEQEGTYPLPEAQLDRFMLSIDVGYPTEQDEVDIVRSTTAGAPARVSPVLDREKLMAQQALVRRLPTSDEVVRYAVRLARATRPEHGGCAAAQRWVQWGAGPRASQYLTLGARVRAAIHGHEVASVEDVRAVARAVLGHRVLLNFEAEAEGRTTRSVIDEILAEVPVR